MVLVQLAKRKWLLLCRLLLDKLNHFYHSVKVKLGEEFLVCIKPGFGKFLLYVSIKFLSEI